MDKRESIGATKRKSMNGSEESEVDDGYEIEERLKNYLKSRNGSKRNISKNIFSDVQDHLQVPKLRKSIVVRAMEEFVSSTPTTATRRNFFYSQSSFNISPVESISAIPERHGNREHCLIKNVDMGTPFLETATNPKRKFITQEISAKVTESVNENSLLKISLSYQNDSSKERSNTDLDQLKLLPHSESVLTKSRRREVYNESNEITFSSEEASFSFSNFSREIHKEDLCSINTRNRGTNFFENALSPTIISSQSRRKNGKEDEKNLESLNRLTINRPLSILHHKELLENESDRSQLKLTELCDDNTSLVDHAGSAILSRGESKTENSKNMHEVNPIHALIAEIRERKNQSDHKTHNIRKNAQSVLESVNYESSASENSKIELKSNNSNLNGTLKEQNANNKLTPYSCGTRCSVQLEENKLSTNSIRECNESLNQASCKYSNQNLKKKFNITDQVTDCSNNSSKADSEVENMSAPKKIDRRSSKRTIAKNKGLGVKKAIIEGREAIDENGNEILTVTSKNKQVSKLAKTKKVAKPSDEATNKKNKIKEVNFLDHQKVTQADVEIPLKAVSKTRNGGDRTAQSEKCTCNDSEDRKSKTKVATEGLVMADSDETLAPRRSTRERRPPPRRAYGVIVTHSEKVLRYYNGTFQWTPDKLSAYCVPNVHNLTMPISKNEDTSDGQERKNKENGGPDYKGTTIRRSGRKLH